MKTTLEKFLKDCFVIFFVVTSPLFFILVITIMGIASICGIILQFLYYIGNIVLTRPKTKDSFYTHKEEPSM